MKHIILSLLVTVLVAPAVHADDRPNILFIFSDDHAAHAISAYGSKINKTPNIDRIAKDGMLFRNCFCENSLCAPSRATILTGKMSHLNGIYMNGSETFDGSQETFPKLMQKAGYQTAFVGKWHLVSDPTGFNYWSILVGQGTYYNPMLITNGDKEKHNGYTTDIITDLTLDWLKNKRDPNKPFIMMYQHKAPHRPWEPDPKHFHLYENETIPEPENLFDDYKNRADAAREQKQMITDLNDKDTKLVAPPDLGPKQRKAWDDFYGPMNQKFEEEHLTGDALIRWKYQRYIKDYLRCIASMDDNIGRVLDYLDQSGLAKNTIVIYSSDQGFFLGDHGYFDKRFMYEESLRMPLIVKWPGVTKPGSENHDLVQNIDYAETFLDIAGAKIPDDMQGRSLVPLLKGQTPSDWRKSIYYHYYELPSPHMTHRHYGIRTDRYKLIDYYDDKQWELFDLQKDPHEMHSVYDDPNYKRIQDDLKAELKELQEKYKDTNPDVPNSVLRAKDKEKEKKPQAEQQKTNE